MNGSTDRCMHGEMDRCMHGGYMDGCVDGCMNGCLGAWMSKPCLDVWQAGIRINGQLGGWWRSGLMERMDKEMNERSAFLKGLFTKSP